MNTRAKISSKPSCRPSFFRRVNVLHPWLKIAMVITVIWGIVVELHAAAKHSITESASIIMCAPMPKHPKSTSRTIANKKLVALTFDDGPSPATTPQLIEVLSQKDAVATFFMVGDRANSHPEIVKLAQENGNEIASHTMHHTNLTRLTSSQIAAEVQDSINVISSIANTKIRFTRPPYGNVNSEVRANAKTTLINWSVDTLDWQNRDPTTIVENVKSQVHDGAIILMHDIYQTSADAVPDLIEILRQEGYEFTTVSELVQLRHAKTGDGEVYYNFKP